jgi:phospholipase C
MEPLRTWAYGVKPGDSLSDTWPLSAFEGGRYHLRVYGPNGFFREFTGDAGDPMIDIRLDYEPSGGGARPFSGNGVLHLKNNGDACTVRILDRAYKAGDYPLLRLAAGEQTALTIPLAKNQGWYDLSVRVDEYAGFEKRFAGRIESGRDSISDPIMGNIGQG